MRLAVPSSFVVINVPDHVRGCVFLLLLVVALLWPQWTVRCPKILNILASRSRAALDLDQ